MTTPTMTPRATREQQAFRALMDGMSRPGTIHTIVPLETASRFGAPGALFESVLDHEVTFAVFPDDSEAEEWLLRSTGSRIAPVHAADYVLASGDGIGEAIRRAKIGIPAYPHFGATIVATVAAISGASGSGDRLELHGPGIRDEAIVYIDGFPIDHQQSFTERNSEVPLGIDLVLIAPDGRFTCLPRYTRIQGGE